MKLKSSLLVLCLSLSCLTSQLAQANPEATLTSDSSLKKELNDFNISINPILMPLGFFDLQFDVGITDAMTIGAFGTRFQYESFNMTTLGGRVNYHLNKQRLTDGWYLSPYAQYMLSSEDFNSFSAGAIVGHQWVYSTGFNIMVGAGASYYASRSLLTTHSGIWPTVEFRLGYTF